MSELNTPTKQSAPEMKPCPFDKEPLSVMEWLNEPAKRYLYDVRCPSCLWQTHVGFYNAEDAIKWANARVSGEVGTGEASVDMLLFCPNCWEQHVDAPEDETAFRHKMEAWALVAEPQDNHPRRWTNPPHRSHLCHKCGAVWRPADVPTNGVAKISTTGSRDTWIPCPAVAGPTELMIDGERREVIDCPDGIEGCEVLHTRPIPATPDEETNL